MFVITLSEVIGVVIFSLVFFALLYQSVKRSIIQSKCKHDKGVTESQSCDAFCTSCGKNLGFIGSWRDKQKEQP